MQQIRLTPRGERALAVAALVVLLAALGFAGWVEGLGA